MTATQQIEQRVVGYVPPYLKKEALEYIANNNENLNMSSLVEQALREYMRKIKDSKKCFSE